MRSIAKRNIMGACLHAFHAMHVSCQLVMCLPSAPSTPCEHMQIDKDEVRLRRSIGAKKDEYTLDRKHVT